MWHFALQRKKSPLIGLSSENAVQKKTFKLTLNSTQYFLVVILNKFTIIMCLTQTNLEIGIQYNIKKIIKEIWLRINESHWHVLCTHQYFMNILMNDGRTDYKRIYRVIQNDCRGFNNCSYTLYTWERSISIFLFNKTTLQVFVTYLTGALYVHPLWFYRVIRNDCRGFNNLSYTIHLR